MSNSELEDHLKCLNSVMLAMKEGATVAAIMKTYEQLNGKECNVAQFGFPNLETLFKSYPDLFYSQGGLWYGQVTDENKDIVRSMATEKSKRKGMNPLRTANHRRHYGAAARFRTGGHLNLHYDANKKNRIQEKGPFSEMRSEHGSWNRQAPTQRGPPTSRVFSFSSEDGSLPDQGVNSKALIWEAPPGFQNQQPLFDNRDRHTPEKEIKPRSFQSVVSGGAASPLLPPGITISAPQNQLRVQSNPISTTEKEKQKMPEMDYLARKIEDLLSNFPEGLPIREISARLDIWAKDDFTPNAQVGFVVKKFSNTFSLSASNGDGIVKVINGAVRPGGSEASNRTRGKEDDSSKWSRPTKTIPNVSNETYFDAVGRNTLTHSNSLTSAVQKPLYENFDGRNWEVNEDSISSRGIIARRGGSHFFDGFRDDYESRGSTMSLSPSRRDDRRNSPVTLINGYHRRPNRIPYEPKKFERKFLCLPSREKVILTHFVTLQEFYIRSCYHESEYKRMLEGMSNDYKGAVEDSECQEWLKGDGAAVWYNRTWQRCVVSTPVQCSDSSFVNVFLIDEGKTVSVTNAQLVPLLDRYHEIPPFAICCTVGEYDTYHGKRHDFILECMRIVEYFMGAGMDGLEVEVLDKIYDGKDKLKVRLTHFGRREVCIPDYLIQEQLIFLQ